MDGTSAMDLGGRCYLCHRIISSEIDTNGDLEAMSICRECKFFSEDSDASQTRYNYSLESLENRLPQLFPDMQPTISDRVNQSRQGRRVLSDTESDRYDSVIGDGDILSYGAYASDSDASVDVTFLDSDNDNVSAHPHDDGDGGDDDDNEEFEEVENTAGGVVGVIQLRRSFATNGRNLPVDWPSEIFPDESIRNTERRQLFGILEERESETSGYINAETDSSRLGALPTAVWFVKNLDLVVVDEKGLVCVICKDSMLVSSVVNRLPCSHVYHPSCIIQWLDARNTCPLCRYELPTDDRDKSHHETQELGSSSESGGGRWWFLAAPLVSLVGIGVVLWLGGVIFGGQRDDKSSNRRWWLLL